MTIRTAAGLCYLLTLLGFGGVTGCRVPQADEASRPQVVATTNVVGDLVRSIAEPEIDVVTLMGPGADPHTIQPRPQMLRQIEDATIIFYNGLRLEGRLEETLRQMASRKRTVAVAGSIPPEQLIPVSPREFDPHVWFDPDLWVQAVDPVVEALSEAFPEHAGLFAQRGAAKRQEILLTGTEVREILSTVPADERLIITSHDAFQYWSRAFGWQVMGLQGVSTESEVAVPHLNRLVHLVVERQIDRVFLETSVNDRPILALKAGAHARGHEVVLGDPLYGDSLGPTSSPTGTYRGMMLHNARAMAGLPTAYD